MGIDIDSYGAIYAPIRIEPFFCIYNDQNKGGINERHGVGVGAWDGASFWCSSEESQCGAEDVFEAIFYSEKKKTKPELKPGKSPFL